MQGVVITGLVAAAAVTGLVALSAAVPQPAAAQFFNSWQNPGGRGWSQPYQPQFWSFPRDPFAPRNPRVIKSAPPVDYSNAPAPRKPETPPATTIAVLGDSLADWLAYGLEDVLGESPEIGILRKIKASSGLIRYDNRVDSDWARVAREILATAPVAGLIAGEEFPGPAVTTSEQVVRHSLTTGTGIYHAVGAAAMGVSDEDATDPELRVRGADGLRVADASVLPFQLSGNTAAPAMLVGYRAADLILGEL